MNIVLVDDSDLVRSRLRDLLHEIPGAQVVGEATTRQEAIVLAQQLQPDLMFLNFQMPEGAGLETLRTIKNLPSPPLLIALTDNINPEYQASCRSAGANYVFDKAIDIPKIQTLLLKLIRSQGAKP